MTYEQKCEWCDWKSSGQMLEICPQCGRRDYLMGQPELPYAGTSGYQGSDTSESRARRDDKDGTTGKRQAETIQALKDASDRGLTWKELSALTGWHHGKASGVLSVLHKTQHIARLKETRDRCKIYISPDCVDNREVEQHRGNIRGTVGNLTKEHTMMTQEQADALIAGHDVLIHQIQRTLPVARLTSEQAEAVVATVADWLTQYRPQELEDIYCTPLDVTAFILRKGEVRD